MSLALRQPSIDTRLARRALAVVATMSALLAVLLLPLPAPDAATAGAGERLVPQPGQQRHAEIFVAPAVEHADHAPLAGGEISLPPQPRPLTDEPALAAPAASAAKAPSSGNFPNSVGAPRARPVPPPVPVEILPPAMVTAEITSAEIVPAEIVTAEAVLAATPDPVRPTVDEALPAYEEFPPDAPPLATVEDWQAYEEFPPTEAPAQLAETPPAVIEVASIATSGMPAPRFQRLDAHGEPAADGAPWDCVRDNRTGLVWEVKTSDGLRAAAHVYSWFDPLQDEVYGARDGGRCTGGIDCDTEAYRTAVNRLALCGFSDWRLPARQELQTLVEVGADRGSATIDGDYFPAALASWYWSASNNPLRPDYAWYVLFRNGLPLNDLKARPKHIRLVRGARLVIAGRERGANAL